MTDPVATIMIAPDFIYDEQQRVKDKKCPTFIKFRDECRRVIDAIIVRLANDMNLCYTRDVKTRTGKVVKEVVPVVKQSDIARHYTQLDINIDGDSLVEEQNMLIDILLTYFREGWEHTWEKTVMKTLCYEYESYDLKELNKRKGDVAKLLTLQHRNRMKEMLRKIRLVHQNGEFDITRKRGRDDGEYDRNARANNIIYILDSPYVKKVRIIFIMSHFI
jgi:hypothetical protein